MKTVRKSVKVPLCKNGHEVKFFPGGSMSCDMVYYNMRHRVGDAMIPDCDSEAVSVFALYSLRTKFVALSKEWEDAPVVRTTDHAAYRLRSILRDTK